MDVKGERVGRRFWRGERAQVPSKVHEGVLYRDVMYTAQAHHREQAPLQYTATHRCDALVLPLSQNDEPPSRHVLGQLQAVHQGEAVR